MSNFREESFGAFLKHFWKCNAEVGERNEKCTNNVSKTIKQV